MKEFLDVEYKWSELKSKRLKKVRGISFEEILLSKYIDSLDQPCRARQKYLFFEYKKYIWVVPCVIEKDYVFLKTIFPSRKYTKIYLRGGQL